MKYRPDIDGLRAFAVLSVLFFHINAYLMPGGFTGVDIFFVISGFLITSILIQEIDVNGRINFIEFYRRRIRRILPSFFLVASVSSVLAALFLLPEDLVSFAKSLRAGLTFTSNHYFADKDDYFDPNSDEFPLLHTWSLSVEEQFYFIWPMLLLSLIKLKSKRQISGIIIFTILASTLLGQMWTANHKDAQRAYFFLFSRFGELLVGCFMAFLVQKTNFKLQEKFYNFCSYAGMLLILASFYVINSKTPFPGFWSLLPCTGAALLIWSGYYTQGPVQKLLSHKTLVWIGLHSYALYLWHWPVLAFYRYLWGKTHLNLWEGISVTMISFVLSVISRKFVELPFNHSKKSFKTVLYKYFAAPSLGLMVIAFAFILSKGLPNRIANAGEREFILNRVTLTHKCHSNYKTNCWNKTDPSLPKALIFGDSHGAHFTPFVRELLPDYNIYAKTTSSCPPILIPTKTQIKEMQKNTKRFCYPGIQQVNKILESEDISIVFLAGRWSSHEQGWSHIDRSIRKTIRILKKKNIQVYFLQELESFNDKEVLTFYRRNYGPAKAVLGKVESDFKLARSQDTYLDLAKEEGANIIKVSVPGFTPPFYNGLLVYRDGHHLTKQGSEILGREMRTKFLQEHALIANKLTKPKVTQ